MASPYHQRRDYYDDRNDRYDDRYEQKQYGRSGSDAYYAQRRYDNREDVYNYERGERMAQRDRRDYSPPQMRDKYQGGHYQERAKIDDMQRRHENERGRRDISPPIRNRREIIDYEDRQKIPPLSTEQKERAMFILSKLREACLARGVAGIKGFGRMFKIYDDYADKRLSQAEFRKGVRDYGVTQFTDEELKLLFTYFDKDGSGKISYDEFVFALRPPMNANRRLLIDRAFNKLDKTGDGVITVEDLLDKESGYDVSHHPQYKSGEKTPTQVLSEFLATFDAPRGEGRDGTVTKEEFINYYAGVSASIDKDVYFDLMMRQAWRLDKPSTYNVKNAKAFHIG